MIYYILEQIILPSCSENTFVDSCRESLHNFQSAQSRKCRLFLYRLSKFFSTSKASSGQVHFDFRTDRLVRMKLEFVVHLGC